MGGRRGSRPYLSILLSLIESRFVVNGDELNVTVSIGVSCQLIHEGDYHISMKTAIREADDALYAAKRDGRNRVKLYS
ncbi:diguanylate cyclase [Bacillus sp. B15-48]|nr:diguanylate cyclase [Bacillus sp. B15-48]